MASTTLSQKWLTIFLSKCSRFCSNFTSMWSNYLSNNVWRDFRIPMSASAMVYSIPDWKINFYSRLPLKLFLATVATWWHWKSIISLYIIDKSQNLERSVDKYLNHMLVKFEQNYMVQTTQILSFWTKDGFLKKHFWQIVAAFLEDVFVVETIAYAKLLISKVPSLSVAKITAPDTCNQDKSYTKHGRPD